MKRVVNTLFFFCLFGILAQGQDFIYLAKKGTAKTKKVYLYRDISIKAKNTSGYYRGTLFQISPEFIMVDETVFYLDSIDVIRTYSSSLKGMTKILAIGTGAFAAMFVINNAIDTEKGDFTNFQVGAVATLATATLISKAFVRKSYPKTKWKWETYQIPIE